MSTPIKCKSCETLFGIEQVSVNKDNPRKTLNIKHRDLYRTIRGGTVEGPCRRCGAMVKWPEE